MSQLILSPPTTATSLQWPFFLADSPCINSCFNLSTMATFFCPQGEERFNCTFLFVFAATFGKVIKLMQHGFQDDAFELLGEQQFGFLREAFLIGLAINKRKPRIIQHDAPSPAKLLEYLEKESNLRRRK